MPADTNIVIFEPNGEKMERKKLVGYLKEEGILVSTFGKSHVRMVTHLDFDDEQLALTEKVLERVGA